MKSSEINRSLDNLFGRGEGATLTRQRVSHELKRLAHVIEQITRDEVLRSLKSTGDVAELYRVSRQSVNTRAARFRNRRGSFGWQVGRGVWVFTPDEVEELRPGKPGRPPSITKELVC